MKRMGRKAAIVLAVAGCAALAGCAAPAGQISTGTIQVESDQNHVLSVNSREQVKVEPDMAEIVYSVYSQASDAKLCQTQNETDLGNVLELLRSQGVEDASIQTSNYGLSPIYDWDAGQTISGYEMTTQVTVSDIPIDRVGQLLSDSVDAGINSIESVNYLCSSYDEAYQEALARAVDAAEVKAQAIAEAGGFALGGILNVQEHSSSQELRYNSYSAAGGARAEAAVAMDMGVMPGQVEIEADIAVDFLIQ